MTPTLLAVALSGAHVAWLAWRWRGRAGRWSAPRALAASVLVVAVVTFWLLAVDSVSGMLAFDWNAARLVPTFSLGYGYDLYYPATEGPIHSLLYGPLAALAFLPATVFRTPNAAVLAGGVLHVAFVLGAMWAFVWRVGGRGPDGASDQAPAAVAAALGACLLLVRWESTTQHLTMLHADGPALALGLLACAALVTRGAGPPSRRALWASAAAVVLSCWSKQISAPLPIGLALAAWWMYGRAVAIRYVAMLAVVGVVVSAAFVLWFGEPMLFNILRIPSRHPWAEPGLLGLAHAVQRVVGGGVWELLVLVAIALAVEVATPRGTQRGEAPAWLPPLLAAVALVPTGALGANKLGGMLNAFFSVYFLVAAVAALLLSAGRRAAAARAGVFAFCLLGVVAAWHSGRCATWARPPQWDNHTSLAYAFASRHPGAAYFPWQPLATLLAEGRLDHFEYGVFDRGLAGFPPSPEHLRAGVPPDARWIATTHGAHLTFKLFGEYSEPAQLPELPGFDVRARPPGAASK